jgi:hypothetical protein
MTLGRVTAACRRCEWRRASALSGANQGKQEFSGRAEYGAQIGRRQNGSRSRLYCPASPALGASDLFTGGTGVGPAVSGVEDTVLDVPTTVNYSGVSVPPCAECGPGTGEVDTPGVFAAFLGSVNLTDFSNFAGSGNNDFFFSPFGDGGTATFDGSGTVTETILTSVPEPSNWAMLLIGLPGSAGSPRLGNASSRRSDASSGGTRGAQGSSRFQRTQIQSANKRPIP